MRARPSSSARVRAPRLGVTVDVVILTPGSRQLEVLGLRDVAPRALHPLVLPWGRVVRGETLEGAARRVAKSAVGIEPAWLEQAGTFGDASEHPASAEMSICWVGAIPADVGHRASAAAWMDARVIGTLGERHRAMTAAALALVRARMDFAPVAFRMLGSPFTLTELQQVYEQLLGRRLHKASFRRALHASWLVEPTNEWRGEGRGRPAQLFKYAPRRRRGHRRGVRFDLL